jgi:hypothetical protein
VLLLAVVAPSCTLCKPFVGAVVAPVLAVGEGGWEGFDGRLDGEAFLCALCCAAAVGAVGGLITGAISDFQALSGAAGADPTANWWHPFRTNADH